MGRGETGQSSTISSRVYIIVPTYNECENIAAFLQQLFHIVPTYEVLVVDDNSSDGTADIVRKLRQGYPHLSLKVRPGKLGLASAYKDAFAEVMERNDVDFVVTMDADFSHPPEYVPVLVDAVKDYDLVIGSRYVPGGRVLNWDLRRRLLSRCGNWYARRITGTPVNDMTAGFVCIRLDFLRRVPLSILRATGYAWSIEFKTMCWRQEARIKEIPITLGDRRAGQSKISTHIVYEGAIEPWRIRFSKF